MNAILDELATQRDRLRQEIMERECLLAAFDVIHKYAASGHIPNATQIENLVSALPLSPSAVELKEPAAPVPAAPPSPPPVQKYVHPELMELRYTGYGGVAKCVRWAIRRMTSNYSAHDIRALLEREGRRLAVSDISTVLTRLKDRGEIEEIRAGSGQLPAIMRCVNPTSEAAMETTSGPAGEQPSPPEEPLQRADRWAALIH